MQKDIFTSPFCTVRSPCTEHTESILMTLVWGSRETFCTRTCSHYAVPCNYYLNLRLALIILTKNYPSHKETDGE